MKLPLKKIQFTCLLVISLNLTYSQNLPTGFSFITVTDELESISSFAFVDANTILIAKQDGYIYLVENEVLDPDPIVRIPTIATANGGDRGLVGIKIDPDYPISPYVYVTYTVEAATHNRVSRFQLIANSIDLSTEEILIDLSPLPNIWHTGGAIVFDDSGHLFNTAGDNSVPNNAQDLNTTHGKVLRINKDGSVPTDNPYYTGDGSVRDLFWGIGLRNPYTMAIHKSSNTIFINDVGKDFWEEVNDASTADRNFGWPLEEGYNVLPSSTYDEPTYAYPHTGDAPDVIGNAITGGAFYDPVISQYPVEYLNKYFFIDFSKQWISTLTPIFDGHDHIHDLSNTRETFGTDIPKGGIYLSLSPDGFLYYYSRITNVLYKLVYYDGDEPLVLESPENTVTMEGERTKFEVNAVGAETLNYEWYKNGNLLSSAPNGDIYSFNNTSFARAGDYQVRVYNSFGEAWSDIFTLTVIPFNNPPTVDVLLPLATDTYQAGQSIAFEASASDIEEGVLPPENFEWFVEFHHNNHVHDAPAFATGVTSGTYIIPDTGETSSDVWYEFIVRVKDELNQNTEASVGIYPQLSNITFETDPTGLDITIDGPSITTPSTKSFVEHLKLPIGAPDAQMIDGDAAVYRLSNWSAAVNNNLYTIPDNDEVLTAFFSRCLEPDVVTNFNYTITPEGYVEFTWDTTNSPCIKNFMLENEDTGQDYYILADREQTSYTYTVNEILSSPTYSFRIKTVNEYGESTYVYQSVVLGIDDNTIENVLVYPSPTKDNLYVSGIDRSLIKDIRIYSILGEEIDVKYEHMTNGRTKIDVSVMSSGLYFLHIESRDEKRKVMKFIKTDRF